MEEIYAELRSKIFSGIPVSVDDKRLKNSLLSRYPNIDTNKVIDTVNKQFAPIEVKGTILFSSIKKYHEAVVEIQKMLQDRPEYKLNIDIEQDTSKNPVLAFDYIIGSFENNSGDPGKVKKCIEHIQSKARVAETKKDTTGAETIRNFASYCLTYSNSDHKAIARILTKRYLPVIAQIEKIRGTTFGIIDLKELTEKSFGLIRVTPDSVIDYQLITLLIRLQCKELKMEFPTVSLTSACPKCGDKEQTGMICTKCKAYIKCPGCKHTIAKDAKICGGCGIELESIDTWLDKIKEADTKISAGDYEAAGLLINPIKTRWAQNEQVITIANAMADLRAKVADYEKKISDSLAKSNYITARRHIEEARHKVVLPASIRTKEDEIQSKIEKAARLAADADKQPAATAKADGYAQAISVVADMEEAIKKLAAQNIIVSNPACRANGQQVQLSWDKTNCNT